MPVSLHLCALTLLTSLLIVEYYFGVTPLLFGAMLAIVAVLIWDQLRWRLPDPPHQSHVHSAETQSSRVSFAIIEASEIPSILLDFHLDVRAHNGAARELFPQLRVDKPLSPAVRNPALLDAARDALVREVRQSVEIFNRDSVERRLMATLVPVRLESEKSNGAADAMALFLLVQVRDLTEQTRLAQMRSDFIANASHELRTPLASLRGFIETMRGPARDDADAKDQFLAIMEEQALRMNRILDDLLSLSRIEMKAHLAPDTIVDLREVLDVVGRGLLPIAQEAGIVVTSISAPEPLLVQGDRHELEQVFQNLIQNAIKYGRQGGRVDIFVHQIEASDSRPKRTAIAIVDNGTGISEEHLPRLTERFYRVDSSASRQSGGTGLGLAIVKHIVVRHRGSLDIASKPGVGSTFTVTFDHVESDAKSTGSDH